MGAGASVDANAEAVEEEAQTIPVMHLSKLPDAIEESIFVYEKFPLIIDPEETASRFLKYQLGTFMAVDDAMLKDTARINRLLVGALQYGRTFTLKFQSLEGVMDREGDIFTPDSFPRELCDRDMFYRPETWEKLLRKDVEPPDPEPQDFYPNTSFVFCICTQSEEGIPAILKEKMRIFKVSSNPNGDQDKGEGNGDNVMDTVASMFGAKETVRNSTDLVDAAFDGDMDEMRAWIDKVRVRVRV